MTDKNHIVIYGNQYGEISLRVVRTATPDAVFNSRYVVSTSRTYQ